MIIIILISILYLAVIFLFAMMHYTRKNCYSNNRSILKVIEDHLKLQHNIKKDKI